jgi:hypothetical protein
VLKCRARPSRIKAKHSESPICQWVNGQKILYSGAPKITLTFMTKEKKIQIDPKVYGTWQAR